MHYVAVTIGRSEKPDLGPLKNWNRFSLLQFFYRSKSAVKQAVICLTVAPAGPDYSRYQGLEKRTRKYG